MSQSTLAQLVFWQGLAKSLMDQLAAAHVGSSEIAALREDLDRRLKTLEQAVLYEDEDVTEDPEVQEIIKLESTREQLVEGEVRQANLDRAAVREAITSLFDWFEWASEQPWAANVIRAIKQAHEHVERVEAHHRDRVVELTLQKYVKTYCADHGIELAPEGLDYTLLRILEGRHKPEPSPAADEAISQAGATVALIRRFCSRMNMAMSTVDGIGSIDYAATLERIFERFTATDGRDIQMLVDHHRSAENRHNESVEAYSAMRRLLADKLGISPLDLHDQAMKALEAFEAGAGDPDLEAKLVSWRKLLHEKFAIDYKLPHEDAVAELEAYEPGPDVAPLVEAQSDAEAALQSHIDELHKQLRIKEGEKADLQNQLAQTKMNLERARQEGGTMSGGELWNLKEQLRNQEATIKEFHECGRALHALCEPRGMYDTGLSFYENMAAIIEAATEQGYEIERLTEELAARPEQPAVEVPVVDGEVADYIRELYKQVVVTTIDGRPASEGEILKAVRRTLVAREEEVGAYKTMLLDTLGVLSADTARERITELVGVEKQAQYATSLAQALDAKLTEVQTAMKGIGFLQEGVTLTAMTERLNALLLKEAEYDHLVRSHHPIVQKELDGAAAVLNQSADHIGAMGRRIAELEETLGATRAEYAECRTKLEETESGLGFLRQMLEEHLGIKGTPLMDELIQAYKDEESGDWRGILETALCDALESDSPARKLRVSSDAEALAMVKVSYEESEAYRVKATQDLAKVRTDLDTTRKALDKACSNRDEWKARAEKAEEAFESENRQLQVALDDLAALKGKLANLDKSHDAQAGLIRKLCDAIMGKEDSKATSREAIAEMERLRHHWQTASQQVTTCARCGVEKHTPWRDEEDGYICAGCLGAEAHDWRKKAEAETKRADDAEESLGKATRRYDELVESQREAVDVKGKPKREPTVKSIENTAEPTPVYLCKVPVCENLVGEEGAKCWACKADVPPAPPVEVKPKPVCLNCKTSYDREDPLQQVCEPCSKALQEKRQGKDESTSPAPAEAAGGEKKGGYPPREAKCGVPGCTRTFWKTHSRLAKCEPCRALPKGHARVGKPPSRGQGKK